MVACPFNIPKYEWGKVLPRVSKCQMCAGRIERSEMPACVSVCPAGVFTFGEKDEILQKGREAIKKGDYIKTIYGEKEVGGTSWLYISDVPFEELGFDTNVPDRSLPSLTWKLLRKVPMILVLWTLILAVIYRFNKYRAARSGESDD
jgi:formate dehydrogenase iron-sulfur subunit